MDCDGGGLCGPQWRADGVLLLALENGGMGQGHAERVCAGE